MIRPFTSRPFVASFPPSTLTWQLRASPEWRLGKKGSASSETIQQVNVSFKFVIMGHFPGSELFLKQSRKEEETALMEMALEEHSRREEEIRTKELESTMLWHA